MDIKELVDKMNDSPTMLVKVKKGGRDAARVYYYYGPLDPKRWSEIRYANRDEEKVVEGTILRQSVISAFSTYETELDALPLRDLPLWAKELWVKDREMYRSGHVKDATSDYMKGEAMKMLIDEERERVTDGFVLRLLRKWLRAGVMLNGTTEYPQEGTPQGGSISPLLANIYLNSIDRIWVTEKMNAPKYNAQMVRYVDDIVILTDRDPTIAMNKIEEMIHSVKLSLNTEKSGITDARNGFDFLGFNFTRRYYEKAGKQVTRMRPSKRSAERFREKVKLILSLRRAHHSSQKDTIARLNLLIIGWTNYFNHTQASGTYHTLQAFLNWKLEKYYRRKHKIPRSYTHIVYNSLPKLGAIPLSGRISYVYP